MEYLIQAAKLLQLSKITIEEVESARDICYLLNPTQIKKFLSIYQPLEYEVIKKKLLFYYIKIIYYYNMIIYYIYIHIYICSYY